MSEGRKKYPGHQVRTTFGFPCTHYLPQPQPPVASIQRHCQVHSMDGETRPPATLLTSTCYLLVRAPSLPTRAKSRDRVFVRARTKRVQRPSQRRLHNHLVVWSRALKCSVKSCVTGSSIMCYFNEFLFMQCPHT